MRFHCICIDNLHLMVLIAVICKKEFFFSVVPYEKIDKTNFLTISSHGVTQYYTDEMVFTPLDTWEREYDCYCKLIKVHSFSVIYMNKICQHSQFLYLVCSTKLR
jgi:hypothetical protein